MLPTPFDSAHQKSFRVLIGKVLSNARAQHIAEALAAGYGFSTHRAFEAAIRAVEAGRRPAPAPTFDADRLIARLHKLGESVGSQDRALRFLLGVMTDSPRHGPPPERKAPDEVLAQQYLHVGLAFAKAGQWRDAGAVLSKAMAAAPASLKEQVVAALKVAAPHSDAAAANLAFALLSADGVLRDMGRAHGLFAAVAQSDETEPRGYAHYWLGHFATGRFGDFQTLPLALSHFEQGAVAGHGEAAFNAGLMHDKGIGVPPSDSRACDFYRLGVKLGHVPSMTNLTTKIMKHDPEAAMDLCGRAAGAGDGELAALLHVLAETATSTTVGGGLMTERDGGTPSPIRVLPPGTGRSQAIVAALREDFEVPRKDAGEITAYKLGFGSWRELARAAKKTKADPPDEERGPKQVRRRRAYTCLDGEKLPDCDGEFVGELNSFLQRANIDPEGDSMDLVDSLRWAHPIQPDVWLRMMEEHFGWVFSDANKDAELDRDQVAVAVGNGGRRLPVLMSGAPYLPGNLYDRHVAREKAAVSAVRPVGAVLMFNRPVGWPSEQGRGGLLYGGLLWWDNAWSDFVLRPGGGLDDALSQRGCNLTLPDAKAVATFGFDGALGLLHSLAAYLDGLEPNEADVRFLRSTDGWLVPLATPLQKGRRVTPKIG